MIRRLLLAGFLFSLAVSAPAQSTYVVDAAGGPGSHFTSLPAAVAAVPGGSFLYVRAGKYQPFKVAGKALHIRGAGTGATTIYLDEMSGSVTVDAVPAGEVFTLEELAITAANYVFYLPVQTSPVVPAPFLALKNGRYFLRGIRFGRDTIIQFGSTYQVSHGAGVLQVDGAELFATGVWITVAVDQRSSDNPGEALPAALAAIGSRVLLKECTLTGSASGASLVSRGSRANGPPGLLLDGSQADLIGLNATGGSGSSNSTGLASTSTVPAGDGGPGILLRRFSLALLDRGTVLGGSMGAWALSPLSPPQFGLANGPGVQVEAWSGVRIRETVVQGATAYSKPAPAWSGLGDFQALLPPLNRPLFSWVRGGVPPDAGRLVLAGAPNDILVLLASSRPAWIPLGDIGLVGTLFVDPLAPGFLPVGALRLSPAGAWELPLRVPSAAVVLGPWYLQAIRAPEGDQTIGSDLVQLTLWP